MKIKTKNRLNLDIRFIIENIGKIIEIIWYLFLLF